MAGARHDEKDIPPQYRDRAHIFKQTTGRYPHSYQEMVDWEVIQRTAAGGIIGRIDPMVFDGLNSDYDQPGHITRVLTGGVERGQTPVEQAQERVHLWLAGEAACGRWPGKKPYEWPQGEMRVAIDSFGQAVNPCDECLIIFGKLNGSI